MITVLRVKNVALIDEAEVEFGPGLNILTGETGAGKSILIDSVNFLLGERPGKDFIRSGTDMATVEGMILLADPEARRAIADMGIEPEEDGLLLLSRTLNAQNRSACRVNGRSVTVGMLKEICDHLVDVHGQHQHQSLLNPNKHIVLLDRFCGEELETLKKELANLISEYREISKNLKDLSGAPGQRESQMEMWQFQINEIESAKLKPGEEEQLVTKCNRLAAVDKLAKNAGEALFLLQGGNFDTASATDQVGKALQFVTELARLDKSINPLAERLTETSVLLADIVEELSAYNRALDADPLVLEQLEARLDVIYRLKKKYGENIIEHYEKIKKQAEKHLNAEDEIIRLNSKRRKQMQAIAAKCGDMTTVRRKYAEMIQGQIVKVLRDLGMKDVQFAISMEKQAAFTANGNDRLEFMISPNLGEPLKPLSQIASGGEMSRIMLALKTVMAHVDRIGTLIFDEIDAGVSGRTAQQVAEKLTQIANSHQILCITHLPQIAAMAGKHFLISKNVTGGQTLTSVQELSYDGAISELARLIGGAEITPITIKAAKEMKDYCSLN